VSRACADVRALWWGVGYRGQSKLSPAQILICWTL
jgi:hypothetical protein